MRRIADFPKKSAIRHTQARQSNCRAEILARRQQPRSRTVTAACRRGLGSAARERNLLPLRAEDLRRPRVRRRRVHRRDVAARRRMLLNWMGGVVLRRAQLDARPFFKRAAGRNLWRRLPLHHRTRSHLPAWNYDAGYWRLSRDGPVEMGHGRDARGLDSRGGRAA